MFPSLLFFTHLHLWSTGKLSDMKSSWSSGPISHTQASLSHELWKVPQGPRNNMAPSRPPPGLTNTKPSSTWGGNTLGLVAGWSSSYSSGVCVKGAVDSQADMCVCAAILRQRCGCFKTGSWIVSWLFYVGVNASQKVGVRIETVGAFASIGSGGVASVLFCGLAYVS